MTTKIRTAVATLAAAFVIAVAAGPAHAAQPNTGDPIHDGYCALLDEVNEYAELALHAESEMTRRTGRTGSGPPMRRPTRSAASGADTATPFVPLACLTS